MTLDCGKVRLGDGVVVCPSVLQAVGQILYGPRFVWAPDEKSRAAAQIPPTIQKTFFMSNSSCCFTASLLALDALQSENGIRETTVSRACRNSYTLEYGFGSVWTCAGDWSPAAAKTLVKAVDAATAPNPSAAPREAASPQRPESGAPTKAEAATGERLVQQAARTTAQVLQTGQGLKRGGKRFGEAMWGPFVKLRECCGWR